jgi:hypothetical protein
MTIENLLILTISIQIFTLMWDVAQFFLMLHIGFSGADMKKEMMNINKATNLALTESQKANQVANTINEFLLKTK